MSNISTELSKRPSNLDEFFFPSRIVDWVNGRIEDNFLQTVLFYGGAGKGKTSLARYLVDKLDYQCIEINASNERGIDVIRNDITSFLGNYSGDLRPKVVIFDECEQLTPDASKALKKITEDYAERHGSAFIFITNEPHRINEALISRCTMRINFDHESDKELRDISNGLYKRITKVLSENKVKYAKKDVVEFIKSCQPDIRKTLISVYPMIVNGIFKYDANVLSESYINIVRIVSSETLKFNDIMQWVQDQSKFTPSSIIRNLDEAFTAIVKDMGNGLTPNDRYFYLMATKITDDFSVKLSHSQNPQITLRHMLFVLSEEGSLKVLSKIDYGRYNANSNKD